MAYRGLNERKRIFGKMREVVTITIPMNNGDKVPNVKGYTTCHPSLIVTPVVYWDKSLDEKKYNVVHWATGYRLNEECSLRNAFKLAGAVSQLLDWSKDVQGIREDAKLLPKEIFDWLDKL